MMKILKILVSIFALFLAYDIFTQFLWPESQANKIAEPNCPDRAKWKKEHPQQSFTGTSTYLHWAAGFAFLSGLIMAKWFLKRGSPGPPTEYIMKSINEKYSCSSPVATTAVNTESNVTKDCRNRPNRVESFLTCRQSKTSLHNENIFLSENSDLKVVPYEDVTLLLDDLKNLLELKIEDVERRLETHENNNILWLKRMEQIESELSFVHHQIYIMLNNMKLPRMSSEIPDPIEQLETMKDLTDILAEVKLQFQQEEKKRSAGESRSSGRNPEMEYKGRELSVQCSIDKVKVERSLSANLLNDSKDDCASNTEQTDSIRRDSWNPTRSSCNAEATPNSSRSLDATVPVNHPGDSASLEFQPLPPIEQSVMDIQALSHGDGGVIHGQPQFIIDYSTASLPTKKQFIEENVISKEIDQLFIISNKRSTAKTSPPRSKVAAYIKNSKVR